ncbi:reticulon-3 isoform X3 [Myripristis murdjan]|uniref:reticulon-3 isoform X3 n=1 Tax=Myripristis murdjan TaxID=586833 RepID=UPI001175D0D9|nr:reticulon-1-like isoform X3 [Myripristis murdjan]
MDPMTQSAQISSSQGFADGQNSAAKDSKLSDSFLSSSPVSLIQSPQDKRVVLGSDKPSEVVATSLRFPSQPGSFSPGKYGSMAGPPDGQPDSPIKTSPVSERIKALEALAAKKKEPDFRSDGGFPHFRERHYEKSPTETVTSTSQKKGSSTDQESPESPFEVLGDLRQVNEFEDTADWMRAHLPPAPDFGAVDLNKGSPTAEKNVTSKEVKETDIVIPDVPAAFASVPDAFMDSPVEASKPNDKFNEPPKQPSVEEESEFDLSFLPTAYMWDQQEKSATQPPSNLNSVPPATPAPPAGFGSPSPPLSPPAEIDAKQNILDTKKTTWVGDLEHPETSEADSSGESDDTVIEDGSSVPPPSLPPSSAPEPLNDPTTTAAPSVPTEEQETPPTKPEKKLMQVPTINVIETDEPNYSEEEMEMELETEEDEGYEVVKDPIKEAPEIPESEQEVTKTEPPKTRPLQTEFMEGYSPPSSPVDSDAEYSPKHKILKSDPETVQQESASKIDGLPNTTLMDSNSSSSQAQPEKLQTTANESKPSVTIEEVDFPDNDDEWSDEAQDILVKPEKTDVAAQDLANQTPSKVDEKIKMDEKQSYTETASLCKSSFMQDDIYDRQSFDYDEDYIPPALDDMLDQKDLNRAKEPTLSDPSQIHIETLTANTTQNNANLDDITSLDDEPFPKSGGDQLSYREYPKDSYSSFQSESPGNIMEPVDKKVNNDIITDNMAKSKSPLLQGNDSKTPKDTKAGHHTPDTTSDPESIEPDCSVSGATDSFVEFMRECLKSRQDEEPDDALQRCTTKDELPKTGAPPSQSPPTMVMDLEQEQLTISALKELGSSQEEEEEESDKADTNAASIQQSSFTSAPNLLSSQSNPTSDSTYSKEVEAIDEWVAEAYHLAEHVLTAILTHLSVKELIHWRDPKKSGVVFGLSMLLLLSLAAFSVISVISYLLLALLCVTITFRIYKSVVQAVQKSNEGHPFKALMDKDVSIPPETFRKHVDVSLTYINRALKQMSRLFLVEDLVDSLKLAVVMWLLTYVGAVFNGITILILADILLFAVPPIYEKNKTQIDQYIDLARTQVNTTIAKLQEKLPGAVKRSKTE